MHPRNTTLCPTTHRAVERLTLPHTISTDDHPSEWPPLIDWISDAVTQNTKRGGASSGEGDAGIDERALEILNTIKNGLGDLRQALFMPRTAVNTKRDLVAAWSTAHNYRAKNELDDTQWEHFTETVQGWVATIEAEWEDRPRRMELVVPCPDCGHRWILDETVYQEQKRRSAVVVEYAAGRQPVAECRVDGCEGYWVGWVNVAKLGQTLSAEQNLEVLKACGINMDALATPPEPQACAS